MNIVSGSQKCRAGSRFQIHQHREKVCLTFWFGKNRTGPRRRSFQPTWNLRPCLCSSQAIGFYFSYPALLLIIRTVRSCPRCYVSRNAKRTSLRSERKVLSHHFRFSLTWILHKFLPIYQICDRLMTITSLVCLFLISIWTDFCPWKNKNRSSTRCVLIALSFQKAFWKLSAYSSSHWWALLLTQVEPILIYSN